jgi:hypothetical protein
MVVYDLICKKKHPFEGWFPSFESYQEQLTKGQITCPTCGSSKVEKVPHACAVISQRGEKEESRPVPTKTKLPVTEAEARELLFKLHHYVRENFEDVGPRFAHEAREMFDGRAEPKSIYGTATAEERRELNEEGIPFLTLPKPKLDG